MEARESLLSELEVAVRSGSQTRRLETLRRVTDLFLGTADLLNEEQIDLFDNVLGQLTSRIEATALAELSQRLAPTDCAPSEIIRRLAWHDEIKVAGPVLEQSSRLGPADLLEIAQTKSQGHLFAISGRTQVEEEVSEVLVRRGEGPVAMRLAANCGARFSQDSLLALSGRAETDPRLCERAGPTGRSSSPNGSSPRLSGFRDCAHSLACLCARSGNGHSVCPEQCLRER